jgi:citrate synthase
MPERIARPGLEDVVVAETRLSSVDGEAGELILRGFVLEELAGRSGFEETVYLLWHGELPARAQLASFTGELACRRSLSAEILRVLQASAERKCSAMDALRMAASMLTLDTDREGQANERDAGLKLVSVFPTIVTAYARLVQGSEPIPPRADLGHAANYLYMLGGEVPGAERVRAIETYLNTVVDHGLNASTFTARVIMSTQSDLVSAIVGAIGALKGPLHGGAPGPALDMVFEIGEAVRAEAVLRKKIEAGERFMGFGHRVYRVRDPRADVLAQAAERLYTTAADMKLYDLARHVEAVILRLLEEYKPGRKLQTNVEFYTALLLHGLELPTDWFTPTFAVSRVAGWVAHCLEQQKQNRLIRPDSEYVGERNRRWKAIEQR